MLSNQSFIMKKPLICITRLWLNEKLWGRSALREGCKAKAGEARRGEDGAQSRGVSGERTASNHETFRLSSDHDHHHASLPGLRSICFRIFIFHYNELLILKAWIINIFKRAELKQCKLLEQTQSVTEKNVSSNFLKF